MQVKTINVGLPVKGETVGGEARPRAIRFGTRRVAVNDVCDRWHDRRRAWWKVVTDEGLYILVCDDASRQWNLAAVVGDTARGDAWPASHRGAAH